MNIEVARRNLAEMSNDEISKIRDVELVISEILKNEQSNLQCLSLERSLSTPFAKEPVKTPLYLNYLFAALCGALIATVLIIAISSARNIAQDGSNVVNENVEDLLSRQKTPSINASDKSLLRELQGLDISKINGNPVRFIDKPFQKLSGLGREVFNFQSNRSIPVSLCQQSFYALNPEIGK